MGVDVNYQKLRKYGMWVKYYVEHNYCIWRGSPSRIPSLSICESVSALGIPEGFRSSSVRILKISDR